MIRSSACPLPGVFLTASRSRAWPPRAGRRGPRRAAELSLAAVLGRLRHLGRDFELEIADSGDGPAYRLGRFKAFLGSGSTTGTSASRPGGPPSADPRSRPRSPAGMVPVRWNAITHSWPEAVDDHARRSTNAYIIHRHGESGLRSWPLG